MRLVSVKRDGGCLFRSLAVALFYHMYGINLGKGQLWGKETTARQIAHNALSRWVRTLIVASLAGHRNVTPHTTFGPMNFVDAMDKAYSILKHFPGESVWTLACSESGSGPWPRHSSRAVSTEGGVSTVYKPENVPRDMLTLSGRYKGESHRAYCRRMLRLCEWGGESEIFVASKIFGVRIVVWGEGHRVMVEYGDKTSMPVHVRLVEEHYDAYV